MQPESSLLRLVRYAVSREFKGKSFFSFQCPPVAVAIAKAKKEGKTFANTNQIDFNVVDISDSMGWDSGPVKREIKCLPWNMDSAGELVTNKQNWTIICN